MRDLLLARQERSDVAREERSEVAGAGHGVGNLGGRQVIFHAGTEVTLTLVFSLLRCCP